MTEFIEPRGHNHQSESDSLELTMAYGSIDSRIRAQERLLDVVDCRPDEFGHQYGEITDKIAGLSALAQSTGDEILAWYRSEHSPETFCDNKPEGNEVIRWLSQVPEIKQYLRGLEGKPESEAFPLLNGVSDACEELFDAINSVTGTIERARLSGKNTEDREIPVPVEVPHPEDNKPRTESSPAAILSLPDDLIERLQGILEREPTPHIGQIVRELFGVNKLAPEKFTAFRAVLHEAAVKGVIRNESNGYWASQSRSALPKDNSETAEKIPAGKTELDRKIIAAHIGVTFVGKPKQRMRYAKR